MAMMPTPDSHWADERARENMRLRKLNAQLLAALEALVADIDNGGPRWRALDKARVAIAEGRKG